MLVGRLTFSVFNSFITRLFGSKSYQTVVLHVTIRASELHGYKILWVHCMSLVSIGCTGDGSAVNGDTTAKSGLSGLFFSVTTLNVGFAN